MRPLTKVSSGASEPPPRDPATGCAACAGPAGSAAATPAAAPALSKLRRDRRLRSLVSSLMGFSSIRDSVGYLRLPAQRVRVLLQQEYWADPSKDLLHARYTCARATIHWKSF